MPDNVRRALLAAIAAVVAFLIAIAGWIGGDDPPPTTTTVATSTTAPPTTTSTTTTTTTPPTTTTIADDLPAAINCRDARPRIPRFDIMVTNGDVDEDLWVTLQYCNELPFEVDQTGGDRYGWAPGDRQGYVCAYGFAFDTHYPEEWQARVSVMQTTEGGYARFNDRYIPDGALTWAGHEGTVGGGEIGDCVTPAENAYSVEDCLSGPPILAIWHDHHLVDVRDFRSQERAEHVTFCLLEHIEEPFTSVGAGIKAREFGFQCPAPPGQDPGLGCVEHEVHGRVTVGIVVTIDGRQVIPAVSYYDFLTPAMSATIR